MKKFLAILTILVGFNVLIYAANTCTNTDQACYVTGPYTNPTSVFRIDAAGNTTINGTTTHTGAVTQTGNVTISGLEILTPQAVVQLSSFSTITPTSKYLTLCTTGTGNINMAGAGTANLPVISTASATNGQVVILTSTGSLCSVTVSSGASAGLDLGSATRLIAPGKMLTLIYNSSLLEWVEQAFGNN